MAENRKKWAVTWGCEKKKQIQRGGMFEEYLFTGEISFRYCDYLRLWNPRFLKKTLKCSNIV